MQLLRITLDSYNSPFSNFTATGLLSPSYIISSTLALNLMSAPISDALLANISDNLPFPP